MDLKNIDNLPLPVDKLPESWFQDERMNAMFAEFRSRSVNSQDWDSKYKFWRELISNWLSLNKKCKFSISEINLAFKRNGKTPRCLMTVIEELSKNGEIVTEDEFLKEPNTWASWAVDIMVKKPITWSFSKVKNYLISNTPNPSINYVHLNTIKELANYILNLAETEKEVVLSVPQIIQHCLKSGNVQHINEENIKLAIVWINRSKQNKSITKYSNESSSDCLLKISSQGVNNVSEQEEGLFKLTENEKIILKKIHDLELEKNESLIKAKASINSGLKDVTKTYLRKKKELEKRIEKQSATLRNIQILISNIHDAKSNTEVLVAYKKGSEILKSFEKAGLSEFKVRDTMDDLHEAIEEMGETQNALSESFKVNTSSDAELEKELEKLMNSDSPSKLLPSVPNSELSKFEKELESLCVDDYPKVPTTPPSISFKKNNIQSESLN